VVRLVALYNHPEDPAAFDAHYRDVHAPIVAQYPGLVSVRLTHPDGVGGRPSAYYLMSEMAFATRADLDAALMSDAGRDSGRDLRNFAASGVTLFIADDSESQTDG
jgi:uncharacterized protein (TIGR02118 family)